ncbi:hypothetical protein X997_5795 [Burkholderia pseudomallei A79C]|nr:hypothetical protein X997_5795 [Burkholderia pseudomallei A79C]
MSEMNLAGRHQNASAQQRLEDRSVHAVIAGDVRQPLRSGAARTGRPEQIEDRGNAGLHPIAGDGFAVRADDIGAEPADIRVAERRRIVVRAPEPIDQRLAIVDVLQQADVFGQHARPVRLIGPFGDDVRRSAGRGQPQRVPEKRMQVMAAAESRGHESLQPRRIRQRAGRRFVCEPSPCRYQPAQPSAEFPQSVREDDRPRAAQHIHRLDGKDVSRARQRGGVVIVGLKYVGMVEHLALVLRAQQARVVRPAIAVVGDLRPVFVEQRRAGLRREHVQLRQAGRPPRAAPDHVQRVVLVLPAFLRIAGDERRGRLDSERIRRGQNGLDQPQVQPLPADCLHAFGAGLHAEIKIHAARVGHLPQQCFVDAIDPRRRAPPVAAPGHRLAKRHHLVAIHGKHVMVELEVGHAIAPMKDVQLVHQALGGLEAKAALKEARRRTERACERTAAAGLDAQHREAQIVDRIMVVRRDRQPVQFLDLGLAVGEAQRRTAARRAPAQAGDNIECPLLEAVEHGGKDLVRFVANDDVELRESLEDLPMQHRRVRAAEQDRQIGLAPLQQRRDIEREQKTAAERGEADHVRALGEDRAARPLVKRRIVSERAVPDQSLRIIDPHAMAVGLGDRGQREQPEMRMHVEIGERALFRHDEIVDEQQLHAEAHPSGRANRTIPMPASWSSELRNCGSRRRLPSNRWQMSAADRLPSIASIAQ